jgi:hypothetical protein
MNGDITVANNEVEARESIYQKLVRGNAVTIVKEGPYQTPSIVRLDGKYIKAVGGNAESAKEWITTSGGTYVPYESLNADARRKVEGLA